MSNTMSPILAKVLPGRSLKSKLQLSFLLVGILSVGVTGWQSFEHARDALEKTTFDRLTSIRETRKRQIEAYVLHIANQLVSLAEDRMVIEASQQFIAAYDKFRKEQEESLAGDILREAIRQSDQGRHQVKLNDYLQTHRQFHPVLQDYMRRFGLSDIFIVDSHSGCIVYSTAMKTDFGRSLLSDPLQRANIATAFRAANGTDVRDFVRLVDFAPYEPSGFIPASFVASPIIEGTRILGVLIFQISITDINNVMTSNNNWKEEGLGETGETYIVGADYRMRTDSRFFIQEPAKYFSQLEKLHTPAAVIQQIQSRATAILVQEVRTASITDALRGNTNTRIVDDYRGVSVLSSYTPLHIPGVSWVIVAEMDAGEAFGFISMLHERLILLALMILLVAATLGFIISQTISRPILSLAKVTERFGKGDLSHRASIVSKDEIGLLASTFNQMADNIMEKTTLLQNEVNERRRAEQELQRSREQLRSLSSHLQSVREEERKGVAREIHDELGQALTTLKLDLVLIRDDLGDRNPNVDGRISTMTKLCDTTIKSVKRIITELRPQLLDDLGLTAAIEWQADEFQQRTGIDCDLSIDPEEIVLDPDRSTAIFRIFQETLTNVARHSGAARVSVRLTEVNGELELLVNDNGRGITQEQLSDPKSFGLVGIRERVYYWGGTVDILSAHGEGTTVIVRFALPLVERRS